MNNAIYFEKTYIMENTERNLFINTYFKCTLVVKSL